MQKDSGDSWCCICLLITHTELKKQTDFLEGKREMCTVHGNVLKLKEWNSLHLVPEL